MDFNDIFRSFFRPYGPRGSGSMDDDSDDSHFFNAPPSFGFFGNRTLDEDDGEDDPTFDPGHSGRFPPSSSDLFFRFEEETQDMFRHFEEMFKNFGLADFPPSAFSRNDEEPSRPASSSTHLTPRDEMLKRPDSYQPSASVPKQPDNDPSKGEPIERKPKDESPSWFSLWNTTPKWHWPMPTLPSTAPCKKDRDLDDELKGRKLDEILKHGDSPSLPNPIPGEPPTSKSYFRSISIQTVRKPDGTVEQRRTETDADGNVTTTVTSTNPRSSPAIQPLRPSSDEEVRCGEDKAWIGQAKTNSIFEKLFGPWGRH